jgi:hypothetical protein
MVGLGGLEPPTSPLSGARSSHLSYRPNRKNNLKILARFEPGCATTRGASFFDHADFLSTSGHFQDRSGVGT